MKPRYHVGQRVFVTPQGLAFSGIIRPGIIARVGSLQRDPRFEAPADAKTYAYEVDVLFEAETSSGLLYEYEIEEGKW